MTAENRRNLRSRAKMKGTDKRPRICVFRSNKHIYAQAIDDINIMAESKQSQKSYVIVELSYKANYEKRLINTGTKRRSSCD